MKKQSRSNKYSFFIRILLPTIITIGLFITTFFLVFIPHFENAMMDRKREMTKELTNSAWSLLNKWHEAELEGTVTKDKAQELAKSQIESLRYGEELKDYFWITDFHPNMIMHPYRLDLNNKDLSDFKDSHGKTLFVEMMKTARENGDGFVDYMWQWKDDSTRIVPKLSYVKQFKPWEWVIGTGIYIEDVRLEIASIERKIIDVSIGITFLITLLLTYIAFQNIKTEKLRLQAEADLHESREKFRSMVEASSEGLIMILEGNQLYFNKTMCEMLGYTEEEINSLNLKDIFLNPPKLSIYDFQNAKLQIDNNQEGEQVETVLVKKDKSVLNALLITSPISFLNNNGVVFSLRDISTSKEIKEDLFKHKENYQTIIDQTSIGFFRINIDKKWKFVEMNNALQNLLNIKSEVITTGLSFLDFFETYHDGEKLLEEIMTAGSVHNRIVKLVTSDNKKLMMSLSAVVIKNEKDKTLLLEGMLQNFSDQKRSEEERNNLIYDLQNTVSIINRPIDSFIKPIPLCNLNLPVSDAIAIMAQENSEALLINTDEGKEIGIVTLSDLKNRLLAKETDIQSSLYNFMSSPLISINISSSIYEALFILTEKNVHHLLVRNSEAKIVGVINSGDLQKAFHITYLFFIQKIQNSNSFAEIKSAHAQAMLMVKSLIEDNRSADEITRMTTIIADAVVKRIIQLVIMEIGQPPCSFAFITLGSEGREEQTLSTDQDNAIIFEDCSAEEIEFAQSYFLKLGGKVSKALDTVGYKFCKGDVMAKNPKWCQPLSIWKSYFTEWITKSEPQDLLDLKIFFDFRFTYGKSELVDELNEHLNHITSLTSSFFVYMAESILHSQVPEGAQKLKSAFDVKLLMLPIVDMVRLYSLKNQISATNTAKRINILHDKNIFSQSKYKNLLQIYNFLMQVRFKHQADQISAHIPPDNIIDPQNLSEVESMIIKKSVTMIEDFQNKIRLDFKGTLTV